MIETVRAESNLRSFCFLKLAFLRLSGLHISNCQAVSERRLSDIALCINVI